MLSDIQIDWLNRSIQAVCPIVSLQLGEPVTILYADEATPAQRTAAEAALAAFDPSSAEREATLAAVAAKIDAPDPQGRGAEEGLRMATEYLEWDAKVMNRLLGLIIDALPEEARAAIAGAIAELVAEMSPASRGLVAAQGLRIPLPVLSFDQAKEVAKARLAAPPAE